MERGVDLVIAEKLMGKNFIGINQLRLISKYLHFSLPEIIPTIQFSLEELNSKCKDHILILGVEKFEDGSPVNILNLRKFIPFNNQNEPCFYNQDWYDNENFAEKSLKSRWYLIRKEILNDSRSKNPDLISDSHNFPTAILVTFTFFTYWFLNKEILYEFDYVWCSDFDSEGDRIYVGRYKDIKGKSKNGFSIHRHLKIKQNYGAV